MGKIRDWFKLNKRGLVIGGAIGAGAGTVLAAGIISVALYFEKQPDGVPVKAEADGIVAQAEESEITGYFSNGRGNEYNNTISGLVNDFDVFLAREFGGGSRIDEDLHIKIESDEEVADDCDMSTWYSGCYRDINSTIYLEPGSPERLFGGIEHEIGHSLRSMPGVSLKELPSQANELYAYFRLYSFNRMIGMHYAKDSKPASREYIFAECKPDKKMVPYMLGAIGFLVQANKAEGDLELALHNVLTAAESQLEKDTKDAISGYDNMCKAYIGEYERLLQQPGLIANMEKHMQKEEAEAFINLLHSKIS